MEDRSRFDHELAVPAKTGHDEQRSAVEGSSGTGGRAGWSCGGYANAANEGCGRLGTRVAGGRRSVVVRASRLKGPHLGDAACRGVRAHSGIGPDRFESPAVALPAPREQARTGGLPRWACLVMADAVAVAVATRPRGPGVGQGTDGYGPSRGCHGGRVPECADDLLARIPGTPGGRHRAASRQRRRLAHFHWVWYLLCLSRARFRPMSSKGRH